MTCDSHANLIPELQFFMILIPIPIPLGLIPILIPIPGFTKINDSDSNFDSSSKWFRFWFQCFPKYLIPILIPIPVSFDYASDSSKPGFDSYSDSGIWLRFRNHLQLWYTLTLSFRCLRKLLYFTENHISLSFAEKAVFWKCQSIFEHKLVVDKKKQEGEQKRYWSITYHRTVVSGADWYSLMMLR